MGGEEQRQQAAASKTRKKQNSERRGRIANSEKIARAARREAVYPDDVPRDECTLSHTRVIWRFEDGLAVLVAYDVYRRGSRFGLIPGVFGRSEYSREIVLALAFQVDTLGLSFDKACLQLNFFQQLSLTKSQAEALLKQLASEWEKEFDWLCVLLANSMIVHSDETSWSINSVWAFLSEKAHLLFFGVHKDAATLKTILDPAVFEGLVISDDAGVYQFTRAQKCWAHLLRKAIKLTLVAPGNTHYRDFTDRLLEIYRKACRIQRDARLSADGRQRKVAELDDAILELCGKTWARELPVGEGPADDFRRLVNELMKLMLNEELFTFVTCEAATSPNGKSLPASGTNNRSERELRSPAQCRDTGRTSKTLAGCRRKSVIISVLSSLSCYLREYTLEAIIREVDSWARLGGSCFERLAKSVQLRPPDKSVLDSLLPLNE